MLTALTTKGGCQVTFPNGETALSVGTGAFQANASLPNVAVTIYNDADLRQSLISVNDYTKLGHAIILTDDEMIVTHKEDVQRENIRILMRTSKTPDERLWHMPATSVKLKADTTATANNVVHNELDANYVQWIHGSLGNPSISTFLTAIERGYLRGLPRLTTKIVRQNPPRSTAISKGHLDHTRARKRRVPRHSKVSEANHGEVKYFYDESKTMDEAYDEDGSPYLPEVYTMLVTEHEADKKKRTMNYTDASGKFPVRSRAGNQYILMSVYNGYGYPVAMPNRTSESYIAAYEETIRHLDSLGHRPSYQCLDNETSIDLVNFFKRADLKFGYVDKDCHRRNLAERAIRDAKNHLTSMLATKGEGFPMDQWDRVLP